MAWIVGAELKGRALERWAHLAEYCQVLVSGDDGVLVDDIDGDFRRQVWEDPFGQPGRGRLGPQTG
jgi:hypothetical protein